MGPMRKRLLGLLMVLTIMMGTIVAASGILAEPVPTPLTSSPAEGAERPTEAAAARGHVREEVGKESSDDEEPQRSDVTRAPRAAEQDPTRVPENEPPAPTPDPVPGGITDTKVPASLGGDFLVKSGKEKAPKGQTTYRVSVEVEDGLPVSVEEFSTFVMKTLNHKKSWAKDGAVTFARTDKDPDLRVILASPGTVDDKCAPLETGGRWSCGTNGRAMINAERWVNGADAVLDADGDMLTYRRYLINHEVGHLLGYGHETCTQKGELAPVMAQQSIRMDGCEPNGWVYP